MEAQLKDADSKHHECCKAGSSDAHDAAKKRPMGGTHAKALGKM